MNMCANLSKTINAKNGIKQLLVGEGVCGCGGGGGGESAFTDGWSQKDQKRSNTPIMHHPIRWGDVICMVCGLLNQAQIMSCSHRMLGQDAACLMLVYLLGSPRLDTSKGHTYVLRNSEQDWEADQGNVESRLLRIYITAVQAHTQTLHLWPVCLSYDSMEIKFICSPSSSSQM